MSETTNEIPTAASIPPTLRQTIEAKIATIESAIEHAKGQAEAEIDSLRAKLSVNAHPLLAQLLEHPIDEIRTLFNELKAHL